MGQKLPEQHALRYDGDSVPVRRRSATPEELAARRATTGQPGHVGASRYSVLTDVEPGGDYPKPERSRTSSVRYPQQRQQQTRNIYHPPRETRALPRRSSRVLFAVAIALAFVLIGFCGYVVLGGLGNWWQTQRDDWAYGRPRTYQADAVVGHDDSQASPSHFIALNLNGQVIVIELPGGNPARAQIYIGPTLIGDGPEGLVPVTLTFEDRNGDGKPDLNIHLGDQVVVFLNNGTKFVPPRQH
jgi:hypothetical protein